MNQADLMNYLQIRYVKLHFTLEMTDGGRLPRDKSSAIRGGMGHALLNTNCIRDEKCPGCDFADDCLVRRMMYPEMKIRPDFMQTQDSEGFIVECEDTNEWFDRGDRLHFNFLLFGRTIAYFPQYLQAFYNLGMAGLGKNHLRFRILLIPNTRGDLLFDGQNIYKNQYKIMQVSDYVSYRIGSAEIQNLKTGPDPGKCRIAFHSPLSLKFRGKILTDFRTEGADGKDRTEAIMESIERRLYILNCFEGRIEGEEYLRPDIREHLPLLQNQNAYTVKVRRFSGTHNSKVTFTGIKGWCDMSGIDDTALTLLLAGELIHIGKNTSFGFGRYTIISP